MNKKNNQKFLGYRNNREYTENNFCSSPIMSFYTVHTAEFVDS